MTTQAFIRIAEEYFGRWQRPAVRAAVADFLEVRTDHYRDILWPLLRNSRNLNYGAPDVKALIDLNADVCDALQQQEGTEKIASMQAPKQIAGPVGSRQTVTQADIDSWPTAEDGPGDRWLHHEEAHEALELVYAKLAAVDQPFADRAQKRWGKAPLKINERGRE